MLNSLKNKQKNHLLLYAIWCILWYSFNTKSGQLGEGSDCSPPLCPCEEDPSIVMSPGLKSPTQHVELLKKIQRKAIELSKGLEHRSYEDKLR